MNLGYILQQWAARQSEKVAQVFEDRKLAAQVTHQAVATLARSSWQAQRTPYLPDEDVFNAGSSLSGA